SSRARYLKLRTPVRRTRSPSMSARGITATSGRLSKELPIASERPLGDLATPTSPALTERQRAASVEGTRPWENHPPHRQRLVSSGTHRQSNLNDCRELSSFSPRVLSSVTAVLSARHRFISDRRCR